MVLLVLGSIGIVVPNIGESNDTYTSWNMRLGGLNMYFDKKRNEVVERCVCQNPDVKHNKVVLDSEQVRAIKLVIDQYQEGIQKFNNRPKWKITKQDMQRVYIAEYTTHDDYGPLRETDVFSEEIDAWAFVLKQRDEGATDISVKPRLVYLDKDRTVNFND